MLPIQLRTFATKSNSNTMNNQLTIERLQNEAGYFLTETKLKLKSVSIQPQEIEVYYYKIGEFEDTSVHRNDLQKNNKNHFYVHRRGVKSTDKYKGGNRGGLDFVVSDSEHIYYSYLIRSAIIDDELVIGPNNVLESIINHCKLDKEAIETEPVELLPNAISGDVLFSERINLGKNAGHFLEYKLRAVICDDCFIKNKYPAKEKMIVDFLMDKVKTQNMTREEAKKYANQKLGYLPSIIRKL